MGTNFYFFRPLSKEEESAIEIVRGLYEDPDLFYAPKPLAVPETLREAAEMWPTWSTNRKSRDPYWSGRYSNHIGKRSAAGTYCWDCKLTLCVGGIAYVHRSSRPYLTLCPGCGKKKDEEAFERSAGAIELGFSKPVNVRRKGVTSVCSWTWALPPNAFRDWAEKNPQFSNIRSEYGDVITAKDFMEMIDTNCPIEFTDSIGVEFS